MGKEINIKRIWLAWIVAVAIAVGIWPGAGFAAVSDGDKATVDYTNLITDINGNTYLNPDYPSVNQKRYLLQIVGEADRYCYCIDPGTDLAASGSKLTATSIHGSHTYWSGLSKKKKQGVTLAAMYGWRSNAKISQVEPELIGRVTEDDVWYATQCIIWEYIRGYRTSPTDRDNNFYYNHLKNRSAEIAYKWILTQMKHHTDTWSFAKRMTDSDTVGPAHMLYYNQSTGNYSAVLKDTNEIEYGMKSITPSSVSIKRNGYNYTVSVDSSLGTGHEDVVFSKKIDYNEQPSFVWEQSNKQVMYTGSEDLIDWTFRITTEEWGRIGIEKVYMKGEGYGVEPDNNAVETPEPGIEFLVMNHAKFKSKYGELYGDTPVGENDTYADRAKAVYEALPEYSQTERCKDKLKTGADGKAQTVALSPGKYWVVQVSGSDDKWDIEPFEVEIPEGKVAGTVKQVKLENEVVGQKIKILKQDAESGIQIEEAGAAFKIRDKKTGKFIKMGQKSATDTFITDASGVVVLPQTLKAGEYELVEISAPYGYALNETPIEFKIDNRCEKGGEILLVMKDTAQKGIIRIFKNGITYDKSSGVLKISEAPLANVEFDIIADEDIETADGSLRAAKDEVVDTIMTDENGQAVSRELYLGRYRIVEKAIYEEDENGELVESIDSDWLMLAECFVTFEYDESQEPVISIDKQIDNKRVLYPTVENKTKIIKITNNDFNKEVNVSREKNISKENSVNRVNHIKNVTYPSTPKTGDLGIAKWPLAVMLLAAFILLISMVIRRKNP